jgi:hypothetical protein
MMVARSMAADLERSQLHEINNAKGDLNTGINEILQNDQSPTDQAQAIQAIFETSMEGLQTKGASARFMPEAARILSRADKAIQTRVKELKGVEAQRAVDNVTPETTKDEFASLIQSLGIQSDLAEANFIRAGQKRISEQALITLSGDALTAATGEDLDAIALQVKDNSEFVGQSKANFEVFGKAAEAAAANGLVDRTKSLLNKLGNDFAVNQARILATAETRLNDVDHAARITTALITGKVEPGQRLSTLPKHLDEARENIALQDIPLGGQIDAFKQLGLPLPPSIKDDMKASFDEGEIREGFAALRTLNQHSPLEAERLRNEIGPKAVVVWDEAFRDGGSPKSLVDAMDALGHPSAQVVLDDAEEMMTFNSKTNPKPIDPVQFVFLTDRTGTFSSEDIQTTGTQRREITSQFKLQLLQQAIRDDVEDVSAEPIKKAAAKRAALVYQQNFDSITFFRGDNFIQLLSRNLGVEPQNLPRFQTAVSAFETFADSESGGSRVLVNRAFNLRDVTYVPAVSDLGGVVAFMAFDRVNDEFRNTSFNRKSQEFNSVLESFNNVIRPGRLDIYDGVRRRAGESDVAMDAGGIDRVNSIINIAKRNWLIDNGARPQADQEDEFQIYLDRATKRARFRSLMPEGTAGGEVPQ